MLTRSKTVLLFPVIKEAIQIIIEKEDNKEIPPTIDSNLLQQILEDNVCKICGQVLDTDANKKVQELLNKIGLSSTVAQQLVNMKAPLIQLKKDANKLEVDIRRVTKDINDYQADIENWSQRIISIDNELLTYPGEKIKNWHRKRKKFEDEYDRTQQKLGIHLNDKESFEEKIAQLEIDFYEEVEKEEKAKDIKQQRDFCVKALEVTKKTRESIMKETRQKIKKETEKIFFDLTWKRKTFKEVNITPEYDISLIHSMGYECLGSLSASERELLAISFFLAIHKVSGFRPPILIDTPVARISGKQRENFGKILAKVSHRKQVILLFTPAEYSKEIAPTMDREALNRYRLKLSSNEKYSIVEEL